MKYASIYGAVLPFPLGSRIRVEQPDMESFVGREFHPIGLEAGMEGTVLQYVGYEYIALPDDGYAIDFWRVQLDDGNIVDLADYEFIAEGGVVG